MITQSETSLLSYAKEHAIKTRVIYGQPQLLSEWTQQGVYGCEWVNMPTRLSGIVFSTKLVQQ